MLDQLFPVATGSFGEMFLYGIRVLSGLAAYDHMVLNIVMLVLSMVLITKGGDLFTDSAIHLAHATRIPPAIIGATIVSVATTFPELMVSMTGVLRGSVDIGVGNALGSCCCNIGLIVGSCAVISGIVSYFRGTQSGIPAHRNILAGPAIFMLAGALSLWAFGVLGEDSATKPYGLVAWQGAALAAILLIYFFYSIVAALRTRGGSENIRSGDQTSQQPQGHLRKELLLFFVGAGLVFLGSRQLVENAVQIARSLHVSELVIGLTIIAIGTSLPEYTVSLMSVIKGQSDLGIGNIIGANVLNICGVVATCAMITPLPIQARSVVLDLPIMILLMLLLPMVSWRNQRISSWSGALMLLVYGSYMMLM